ncbi:MAG TPA: YCF48-related protein, partial [Acidimicrobiales bacterium]
GYLGFVDLVSKEEGFLVGGRSSLLETRDGGKVWSALQPLIGSSAGGTFQVEFFNLFDGTVLGNDDSRNERLTLWRTIDGGASWITVVPRLTSH